MALFIFLEQKYKLLIDHRSQKKKKLHWPLLNGNSLVFNSCCLTLRNPKESKTCSAGFVCCFVKALCLKDGIKQLIKYAIRLIKRIASLPHYKESPLMSILYYSFQKIFPGSLVLFIWAPALEETNVVFSPPATYMHLLVLCKSSQQGESLGIHWGLLPVAKVRNGFISKVLTI